MSKKNSESQAGLQSPPDNQINWEERREAPRVPLDKPVFARLFLGNNARLQVMVTDISPGGTKLTLPPSGIPKCFECGLLVSLNDFPLALSPLNGLSGTLAWKELTCCGIRFDEALGIPLGELIGQSVRL
ncbi:MAG: PilZ domain-containing protein [Deltaproteobacteria bacterium]|jgi:hypothetical protein|nr:PilZ domain-containing protein [Deltaproteobacteria bacterium]